MFLLLISVIFLSAVESVSWPVKAFPDVYVDKAHSNLLEILVTTGIFGFLIFLAIIFRALDQLFGKKVLLVVFLLFLFHSQTNVISINEELIFWLILGIVGSQRRKNLQKKNYVLNSFNDLTTKP